MSWRGPVFVYVSLAMIAVTGSLALGRSPLATEPWLPLPAGSAACHALSLTMGCGLAIATIGITRHLVKRREWARALHNELRPAIRHSTTKALVVVGIASSVSEELFFRGLLATTVGVLASSLTFGLLHQVRGRGRWIWAGWATVMGLLFGSLFMATGSLLGPLVAHATINVANLLFLRDTRVDVPTTRRLGGLLRRR